GGSEEHDLADTEELEERPRLGAVDLGGAVDPFELVHSGSRRAWMLPTRPPGLAYGVPRRLVDAGVGQQCGGDVGELHQTRPVRRRRGQPVAVEHSTVDLRPGRDSDPKARRGYRRRLIG